MTVIDKKELSQNSKEIIHLIDNDNNIPPNSNESKLIKRIYANLRIQKINEFEFLIENTDFDIDTNKTPPNIILPWHTICDNDRADNFIRHLLCSLESSAVNTHTY